MVYICKHPSTSTVKNIPLVLMFLGCDTVALKVHLLSSPRSVSWCTVNKMHSVSLTTCSWTRASTADVPGLYFTLQSSLFLRSLERK